jgi:hypothetical protein
MDPNEPIVPVEGEASNQAPRTVSTVEPATLAEETDLRTQTSASTKETLDKLPIDASFEELVEKIPEVKAMVGMDQRSDFHSLTLDEHTKELLKQLAANPLIAGHPKKDAILLAGKLHDVGKTSPDGQQVHPKDPEKRQYVGHEKESAKMIEGILPKHFVEISEEDKGLIISLAALHASALDLIGNFSKDNQPKGKSLASYDSFIAKVEQIPGGMPLEEKMRIIFSLNRADKKAGYNDASDKNDPKVASIVTKSDKQVASLDELEKALPVLLQAVLNKRNGDNEAGIECVNGVYKLREKPVKAKVAPAGMDEAKIMAVMAKYDTLGLPPENKEPFETALRTAGIPGLGKAGFGKTIGAVKKLVG